jgi:hypothetical protein
MFPGVFKVSYGIKQENVLNKSLKRKATSFGVGSETPDAGKLGLYMEDAVALQNLAKGSLTRLKPFYTTVVFTNEDSQVVTDVVYWKFASDGRDIDGNPGLKTEYDMFVIDVKLNV